MMVKPSDTVIRQLISYGTMISMGVGVLIYLQSTFVSAMDWKEQQYIEVVEDINYLRDKRLRLEDREQILIFEDRRKLERLEDKKDLLEQQIKN